MNKILIFIYILISCLACRQQERVVYKPLFKVQYYTQLEIDHIVLNDSATIIYMSTKTVKNNAYHQVKPEATYLQAGEKKYALQETKNMTLVKNNNFLIPTDSLPIELIFPPLSDSIKEIDLILGSERYSAGIWGIQLKKNKLSIEKSIPDEIRNRKADLTREWQSPGLSSGLTRLEVHIVGYQPGMQESVRFLWRGLNAGNSTCPINEQGVATIEFMQYGPVVMQCHFSLLGGAMLLVPGEHAKIYIDLNEAGRRMCSYRQHEPACPVYYCSGHYADLNTILINRPHDLPVLTNPAQKPADMNEQQYMDYHIREYQHDIQYWDQIDSLGKEYAHYQKLIALDHLVKNVVGWDRYSKMAANLPIFNDDAKNARLDHFKILQNFPVNNYDFLLLPHNSMEALICYLNTPEKLKNYLNVDSGFLTDLCCAKPFFDNFYASMPFRDEQVALFDRFSPFLRNMCQELQVQYLKYEKERKAQSGYKGCSIPEVADEQLFDAILAKYKGKVIFVDFWATWCGPCKSGIKFMQPIKERMQEKGVAFIFITSESSPLKEWEWQIPDIKGDHYRLTRKQWMYLVKQLNIHGIPSYRIIKKTGEHMRYMGGIDNLEETLLKEINTNI